MEMPWDMDEEISGRPKKFSFVNQNRLFHKMKSRV